MIGPEAAPNFDSYGDPNDPETWKVEGQETEHDDGYAYDPRDHMPKNIRPDSGPDELSSEAAANDALAEGSKDRDNDVERAA
jgi:hypothetical protein